MEATNLNSVASANIIPAIINPNVNIENKPTENKVVKGVKKKDTLLTTKEESKKQAKKETTAKIETKTKVKTAPKANTAILTQKDALKSLRDANKETKTLSGVIKTIRTFWNDGYKDAFKFLNMTFNDIDVKKIMALWSDSLKDENGVFMYKSKVAKFKMNKEGKKDYILNKEGKKIYETVLKQYNDNFSVIRIFDAMLTAKIEKGEVAL